MPNLKKILSWLPRDISVTIIKHTDVCGSGVEGKPEDIMPQTTGVRKEKKVR